ncbi:MAG: hypothetical protein ACRDK2_12610 [Solirubrobacteraceae bacterium]
MTRHHSIALTIALMSVACGLICSTATASPLLSGYGGPGGGEQVIIGSQLLNTTRAGGGARGGTASKLQSATQEPGSLAAGSGIAPAQTVQHTGLAPKPLATAATPKFSTTTASADRSPRSGHAAVPSTPASQPASELAQSTQTSYDLRSGLTNGELALIALVVGGLLALAIGTRSLSRLQR